MKIFLFGLFFVGYKHQKRQNLAAFDHFLFCFSG